MAYIQSFEIGATSTLANVESLSSTHPNMAPRSKFLAYAETAGMASGLAVGRGNISAIWQWGFIPADMFAALRVICPGASASVYIRTMLADYSTYGYYTAKMIWPALDSYEYRAGVYQPFELTFQRCTVFTP